MKMDVICNVRPCSLAETGYKTTRRNISEDSNFKTRRENLKSHQDITECMYGNI
jgi:hypothetical protein